MKIFKNFSFGLMIFCSIGIGLSGFTSNRDQLNKPFYEYAELVPAFGFKKEMIDPRSLSDKTKWIDAVDDEKPDNTGYQLIRWEQQHYHNKL